MDVVQKMFWSLIVKPEKRYQQTVEESFHVSQACMEPVKGAAGNNAASTLLYVELEGNDEILVAVLAKDKPTQSLDLNFGTGESITFRTEGPGTVHLSGYLHPEDAMDYSDEDMEDMEDEEEEDLPTLVPAGKGKASALDKMVAAQKMKGISESTVKKDKEVKKEIEMALNMRKKLVEDAKKNGAKGDAASDDDEDDEDDEDYEDMDEEEEGEEEEEEDDDDDDEDDDDDDDDDDEDDEEEEDEDEEEEEVSPKKNGKIEMNGKAPKPKEKGKENQTPKKNEPTKAKNEPKTPKTPNNAAQAPKTPKTPSANEVATAKTPKTPKRTLKGGIVVEDLKVGSGPEAARGKMCGFFYEGRLKDNNKKFDACQSGDPFKFRMGSGEVIKGWDVGLEGMKVGGKRRLIVPAKMAYGDKGAPPSIPPNATLVFEVECKNVK